MGGRWARKSQVGCGWGGQAWRGRNNGAGAVRSADPDQHKKTQVLLPGDDWLGPQEEEAASGDPEGNAANALPQKLLTAAALSPRRQPWPPSDMLGQITKGSPCF